MGWEKELAAANRAKAKKAREDEKLRKEQAKKLAVLSRVKPKPLLQYDIWMKVEDAIGATFPDGDPIDSLYRWMEQNLLTIEHIDRAVNRYAKVKNGLYDYMCRLWDDRQADEMADAKVGVPYENNPFWFIRDGKVVPFDNPWKST